MTIEDWNEIRSLIGELGLPTYAERRRYALLQAAATLMSRPDTQYSEAFSYGNAVTCANQMLALIESRESEKEAG